MGQNELEQLIEDIGVGGATEVVCREKLGKGRRECLGDPELHRKAREIYQDVAEVAAKLEDNKEVK